MSIMCGEIIVHDNAVLFFKIFLLENVVIPNYNQCFKLILTHKIEQPLRTRVLRS